MGIVLCVSPLTVTAQQPPADIEAAAPVPILARREAVQRQIEALGPVDDKSPEKEAVRSVLQGQLGEIAAIEAARERRDDFSKQLAEIPRRLREVKAERRSLDSKSPRRLPQVSEQLRDEYGARVEAARARVGEVMKQAAVGELRLVTIPKEVGERKTALDQIAEVPAVPPTQEAQGDNHSLARAELVRLQRERNLAEIAALEAERSWLLQRAPLQDDLLMLAQLRLRRLQEDLGAIKKQLGEAIEEELAGLDETQARLREQMHEGSDPTEAAVLEVSLQTLKLRRATVELRQDLEGHKGEVLAREKRNADLKQAIGRLQVLVEKYASGDVPASGLLIYHNRLEREHLAYRRDSTLPRLESKLRKTNAKLFALEDRLYEFDGHVDTELAQLETRLEGLPDAERDSALQKVRNLLGEQRTALREQQQVYGALAQEIAKAKSIEAEYQTALNEGYLYALNQMLWLPDSAALGIEVIKEMLTALVAILVPLTKFAEGLRAAVHERWVESPYLTAVALLLMLVLAGIPSRLDRILRRSAHKLLDEKATRNEPPGPVPALLTMLRAAVWPAYIALVVWLFQYFLGRPASGVTRALENGLHLGLFTLFVVLACRDLLRPNGWARQYWSLDPKLGRYLRRSVSILALAALLFLVPRGTVVALADEGVFAVEGLPLARLLFLSFQMVVLGVIGVVGRRDSPLMQKVLGTSREQQALAWRSWPLVHAALLLAVVGDIGLDVFGYSYTAATLWFRAVQSAAIVILFYAWLAPLARRLLGKLARFAVGFALPERTEAAQEALAARVSAIAYPLSYVLLALLVIGTILEVWGLPVLWIVTLPLIPKVLGKAAIIGLLVALAYAVVRLSHTLMEHFLKSRAVGSRPLRAPGRKLKTLLPLAHTVIKVVAIFLVGLAILEQLGVETGPLLAGIGIFGLAVGFASQSLIKDVINGLFILLEGSLSIGDVVTLRGTSGQVEKFTLRAVTVRDLSGNVHVIPNSAIDVVTNMTKGYSMYVLDVAVAYHQDIDAVIAILRDIDQEMHEDHALAKDMLEPIEILGLDRVQESAAVIRARLKTRPLEQWRIGREFQARMKKHFARHGIEIPSASKTVYVGLAQEPPLPAAATDAGRLERSSG